MSCGFLGVPKKWPKRFLNILSTAYSSPLPGVREVLYERGSFYVLTAGNKLVMLQEIDIHQKLEVGKEKCIIVKQKLNFFSRLSDIKHQLLQKHLKTSHDFPKMREH